MAVVFAWLRSRQGLALTAIRDSETAAGSIGVNNDRTKYAVYLLAALVTGMIGALIYLEKLRISPDAAFDVIDWTADVIFIVVIGGIGSIEGPFIGALVFFGLAIFLGRLWRLVHDLARCGRRGHYATRAARAVGLAG